MTHSPTRSLILELLADRRLKQKPKPASPFSPDDPCRHLKRSIYVLHGQTVCDSPVATLVREINEIAIGLGCTLSRWQSSGSGRKTIVHWAVHRGPKHIRFKFQKDILASVEFEGIESNTTKCKAWKYLALLKLEVLRRSDERTSPSTDCP